MTRHNDIIIIGAGAAGLMAAKELSASGYRVTILEANSTAGGRMCTLADNKFGMPVEAGAEFIHGKLPLTLKLLKQAGIEYKAMTGQMFRAKNGRIEKTEDPDRHWDELMQRMDELKEDMTIHDFLIKFFAGEKYAQLRKSVQSFAEGFDLADINRAAVMPLKKEWMHEDEKQYRITGGYTKLAEYLVQQCLHNGVHIHFNCRVTGINWKKGEAMVTSADNKTFAASKLIITVSAGILQSGQLLFSPELTGYRDAVAAIGFGSVIKILLQFRHAFWKKLSEKTGFILSDEAVPTWWTQLPDNNTLLTGWLGGPKAYAWGGKPASDIIQLSLQSLSSISGIPIEILRKDMLHAELFNWGTNEYTLGGYSYNTLSSADAKRILREPVENTIFFAGEALYIGDAQGTVEAALETGAETAMKIYNAPAS